MYVYNRVEWRDVQDFPPPTQGWRDGHIIADGFKRGAGSWRTADSGSFTILSVNSCSIKWTTQTNQYN